MSVVLIRIMVKLVHLAFRIKPSDEVRGKLCCNSAGYSDQLKATLNSLWLHVLKSMLWICLCSIWATIHDSVSQQNINSITDTRPRPKWVDWIKASTLLQKKAYLLTDKYTNKWNSLGKRSHFELSFSNCLVCFWWYFSVTRCNGEKKKKMFVQVQMLPSRSAH